MAKRRVRETDSLNREPRQPREQIEAGCIMAAKLHKKIWQGNDWQRNAKKSLQAYSPAHHSPATSGISILRLRFGCGFAALCSFAAMMQPSSPKAFGVRVFRVFRG
jgi:hypothetical protein